MTANAAPTTERSLQHFSTKEALRMALQVSDGEDSDWKLTNFDPKTTRHLKLGDEFSRLLVLKSYDILDTQQETEFDEITNEAKRYFDVPMAVVSLVDMGRQWFKSACGLDAKQTPRSCAFCAHTIQRPREYGVLVVPDATKDERFVENPLVTGDFHLRFYAGAPLISPEGPCLGALCIIDTKTRPQGLSKEEETRLLTLADEVVYNMITRV